VIPQLAVERIWKKGNPQMTQMCGSRVAQAKPAPRNDQDHRNNESIQKGAKLSLYL
jgi:hypothetical protein